MYSIDTLPRTAVDRQRPGGTPLPFCSAPQHMPSPASTIESENPTTSEPAATQLRHGMQVLAHPPRLPAFSNSPTPTLYSWRTDPKAARFPEPWNWPQERVTLHKFPAHYNLFMVFLSPLLA